VSPPQSADGQRSHAIRVARTAQPAASQAEATGPECSHGALQAAPAAPASRESFVEVQDAQAAQESRMQTPRMTGTS
jgi:hypothetical protein